MAITALYHVVGPSWQDGEDLLPWDELVSRGLVTAADWRWSDADVGSDGDRVCCVETLEAAAALRDEVPEMAGRRIVEITVSPDWLLGEDGEGSVCVVGVIPHHAIRVVD